MRGPAAKSRCRTSTIHQRIDCVLLSIAEEWKSSESLEDRRDEDVKGTCGLGPVKCTSTGLFSIYMLRSAADTEDKDVSAWQRRRKTDEQLLRQ